MVSSADPWVCPGCGFLGHGFEETAQVVSIPFVAPTTIVIYICTCPNCGTSGDFLNCNDDIIDDAYTVLEDQFVRETIDFFKQHGYSKPALDRILSLPQGTLDLCCQGDFPHEAVALFRVLRTYPWILKLAEENFEQGAAEQLLVTASIGVLKRYEHARTPKSKPDPN